MAVLASLAFNRPLADGSTLDEAIGMKYEGREMELKLLLEEHRGPLDVLKNWALRGAVALLFIFVGTNKFATNSEWVRIFDRIGFGQWFRYFTGTLQVGGALLVLIPRTFAVGIIILACTMAGAVASWVFLLGEPLNAFIPCALLGGLLAVGGEDLIELVSYSRKRWFG